MDYYHNLLPYRALLLGTTCIYLFLWLVTLVGTFHARDSQETVRRVGCLGDPGDARAGT